MIRTLTNKSERKICFKEHTVKIMPIIKANPKIIGSQIVNILTGNL